MIRPAHKLMTQVVLQLLLFISIRRVRNMVAGTSLPPPPWEFVVGLLKLDVVLLVVLSNFQWRQKIIHCV
jgi:hypothetical protein